MIGRSLPRNPDSRESVASAKARLALLLSCAPDQKLAGFTVDSLAATHRVPRKAVAEMLLRAQLGRSARG
jgi:hypothetical protein